MTKAMIQRRLIEAGDRIKQLRDELSVANEQLNHFSHEADDARLRSLVSETALAGKEHREADKHAQAMMRHRDRLTAEIGELEQQQDDLLDQLMAADQ